MQVIATFDGAAAVVEQPADRHRRRAAHRRRRRGGRRPSTCRPVPSAGRWPVSRAATPAARSPSPKRAGRFYCRNSFSSGSRTARRPRRPPRGARPGHRTTDRRRPRPPTGHRRRHRRHRRRTRAGQLQRQHPGHLPLAARRHRARDNTSSARDGSAADTTPPATCCSSPTTATLALIRRRAPRRRRRLVRLGPGRQPDHRPARRRHGPGSLDRVARHARCRSSPMAPPASTT